jgi:hypothetical protein
MGSNVDLVMVKFEHMFFSSQAEKLKDIIQRSQLSDIAFRKSLVYLQFIQYDPLASNEEPLDIVVGALIVASRYRASEKDLQIRWSEITNFEHHKIYSLQNTVMQFLHCRLKVTDSETATWNMFTTKDFPTNLMSKQIIFSTDRGQFNR